MSERLNAIVQAIRNAFARSARGVAGAGSAAATGLFNARGLIFYSMMVLFSPVFGRLLDRSDPVKLSTFGAGLPLREA